jgi:hypothetical protein
VGRSIVPHTLNLCRVSWLFESGVMKESVDSGEPQVATARDQTLMLLDVIENATTKGASISSNRRAEGGLCTLPSELEELAEGVAVGADCVRTDRALLDQTLHEETLQERSETEERGHGRSSQRRSSRDIASRINSGSALKYQKVSLQWT